MRDDSSGACTTPSIGGSKAAMAGGLLLLLYPLAVFFGLRHFDSRWLALLLVAAAGWRLWLHRHQRTGPATLPLLAAALCATMFTLATGSSYGLLLYPVMVNVVLLVLFVGSLLRPPSVIETLARLREPDLPPRAVDYTRKVTGIWATFFALNGAAALVTVFLDPYWWTLYNGLVAYVLMGLLMGTEWLVRRRVRGAGHG